MDEEIPVTSFESIDPGEFCGHRFLKLELLELRCIDSSTD
jgi:hypothetical protein